VFENGVDLERVGECDVIGEFGFFQGEVDEIGSIVMKAVEFVRKNPE